MIMSKLDKNVLADIEAGNSVILISGSGRGKSDYADQLYKRLKAADPTVRWGRQDLFLATQTPPDLIGLQFKGQGEYGGKTFTKSDPTAPLWYISKEGLPAYAYDRFFLLLDEYGQGEADVKRAAAELTLKQRIQNWQLPRGSVVLALSNQGSRYGVTKDFDFCINRQSRYGITDDLESFLIWADKGYEFMDREWTVSPAFRAFAKQNSAVLFEPEPKEQGPWCTPRSLVATDRYWQSINRQAGKDMDPSDPLVCEGFAAKIGVPASSALSGFLQFRISLPQMEQIVADPTGIPVPVKPDMQMLLAYELAARVSREDLAAVITYVRRMTKDLGITFMQSLVRRDHSVVTHSAVEKWLAQNASMVSVLAALG